MAIVCRARSYIVWQNVRSAALILLDGMASPCCCLHIVIHLPLFWVVRQGLSWSLQRHYAINNDRIAEVLAEGQWYSITLYDTPERKLIP